MSGQKLAEAPALSFSYRFPSPDDAAVAPHSLDDVLAAFGGASLISRVDHGVNDCLITLLIDCDPDNAPALEALEPDLVSLLDNWADSSNGYQI